MTDTPKYSAIRRFSVAGAGVGAFLTAILILSPAPALAQFSYEEEPISYSTTEADDPIARLQRRIDAGEAELKFDERHGYLSAVLTALDVPVSSQVLVFSKTSVQLHKISPKTPRAVYFNDDVYVGWVQRGDVLEFSSVDPQLGAIFYLLEQRAAERPKFMRQTDRCLLCHSSSRTEGVPGHLVRSVYPDANGMPVYAAGTYSTDHRSPLEKRWGGWYVTGKHGSLTHMGNMITRDKYRPEDFDRSAGANVTDLSDRFDTKPYRSGHSDLVALMVLEHQTRMHNLITQAGFQGRIALHSEAAINKALDRPQGFRSESMKHRFAHAGDRVLKYMLFADEANFSATIAGTSSFTHDFPKRGPKDRKGRSLRDFDLNGRIFKYRCSYLIYSESFDSLPQPVKEHVYRRLWEILTGADSSEEFSHFSSAERRAILEILRDTKKGLPSYWKPQA